MVLQALESPDSYTSMPTHPNGKPMAKVVNELSGSGKFDRNGVERSVGLALLDENEAVIGKVSWVDVYTTVFAIMADLRGNGLIGEALSEFFNHPDHRGPSGEDTLAYAILQRTLENWNRTKGKHIALGKTEAVAHVLLQRNLVE